MSGIGGSANGEDEEEGRREMVRRRLEGVGYRVGLGIVERFVYAPFLSILVPARGKNKPRRRTKKSAGCISLQSDP